MPDIETFIRLLAVRAIPVIFAITLHEAAHAWMARRFGDRTAELLGRLSLNPLKHVDPIGTIVVPMVTMFMGGFMFGWAKPVPINARSMRNPRRAMTLVAAAGPGANLGMALGWALVLRIAGELRMLPPTLADFIFSMASFGIFFNALLFIFNLFPIPPLDGGRVLRGLGGPGMAQRLDAIEPYGLIIVIALLVTGILGYVLGPPLGLVQAGVLWVAGVKG